MDGSVGSAGLVRQPSGRNTAAPMSPLAKQSVSSAAHRSQPEGGAQSKAALIPREVRKKAWATMRRGGQINVLASLPAASPERVETRESAAVEPIPTIEVSSTRASTPMAEGVEATDQVQPMVDYTLSPIVSLRELATPTGDGSEDETDEDATVSEHEFPLFGTDTLSGSLESTTPLCGGVCSPTHEAQALDLSLDSILGDRSDTVEVHQLDQLLAQMGVGSTDARATVCGLFVSEHGGTVEGGLSKAAFARTIQTGAFGNWLASIIRARDVEATGRADESQARMLAAQGLFTQSAKGGDSERRLDLTSFFHRMAASDGAHDTTPGQLSNDQFLSFFYPMVGADGSTANVARFARHAVAASARETQALRAELEAERAKVAELEEAVQQSQSSERTLRTAHFQAQESLVKADADATDSQTELSSARRQINVKDRELRKLRAEVEQTQASLAEAKAKGVEQEMMCHHLGAELSRMEAALANADASKTQIEAQATRIAIARDRMATRLAETQAEVNAVTKIRVALQGELAEMTATVAQLRADNSLLEVSAAGQRQGHLDETEDLNATIESLRCQLMETGSPSPPGTPLAMELGQAERQLQPQPQTTCVVATGRPATPAVHSSTTPAHNPHQPTNTPAHLHLQRELTQVTAELAQLRARAQKVPALEWEIAELRASAEASRARVEEAAASARAMERAAAKAAKERDDFAAELAESESRYQAAAAAAAAADKAKVALAGRTDAEETAVAVQKSQSDELAQLKRCTTDLARRNKEYRRVNRLLAADVKMFLQREQQRASGQTPCGSVELKALSTAADQGTTGSSAAAPRTTENRGRKGSRGKRGGSGKAKTMGSPILRRALTNSMRNKQRGIPAPVPIPTVS